MKNKINKYLLGGLGMVALATMTSCSDSFLEQDPLSFFAPETTYTSESGLAAAMATCDYNLKYVLMDGNANMLPICSVYFFTDIGLYGKTDTGGAFMDDCYNKISATSGMAGGGDSNAMTFLYNEFNNGIKYANTVLSYIDDIDVDDDLRNAYKGRAYFHRAWRYYNMCLLWGDVPLITRIMDTPKNDFKSCSKTEIFKMLKEQLEFAVEYVPAQSEMSYYGAANKEGCMMLLAKVDLALGYFAEAQALMDDLINNYGHQLMTSNFGTNVATGNSDTWPVTRNVLWDLHRGVNVTSSANKETLMAILNFNSENFTYYPIMRVCMPHWSNSVIKTPDNQQASSNYSRSASEYNNELDWLRAVGRGIGDFRSSKHYNLGIWTYDGEVDEQDLRHNREVGNWICMEDFRYNNPKTSHYGENYRLYADEDYVTTNAVTGKETVVIAKGALLCSDTIRSWYPWPHYKFYVLDESAEEDETASQFNGATQGTNCSNGNLYLYRLAEAYLLRAEAKFYQGNPTGAAEDVNVVRKRANAKKMFTTVTIGDIMDERARELYLEEWRHCELVRVSWALAQSGKADEFGNTYSLSNWDQQTGLDSSGGSYWYQRCINYNLFNKGNIISTMTINYQIGKHNMHWPIPNSVIIANIGAALHQNIGYSDYDASAKVWDNWHDAVADELVYNN